ncbi:lytic transglycosylase domain-containing protein [Gilliamella sp. BG6]|uniref:lytic transglycosylase domain-containing protein n=1 Tax=unclassified Gilliamella TaxID=2685620 RepID=UPI0039882CAF
MSALSVNLLFSLFAQCAPDVAPETLNTLIGVESQKNPYAVAVVYDKDTKKENYISFSQPMSEIEAQNIITTLQDSPFVKSYSVGLMQVNSTNFKAYGITKENMFNTCKNIEVGAEIFKACYAKAKKNNLNKKEQEILRIASSCYYSGNEKRGYQIEANGTSYVDRINAEVAKNYKVPAIKPLDTSEAETLSEIETDREYSQPSKTAKPWDIFEDYIN